MKEKAIVIGGGVGPMAGVDLHAKIIANTLTDGRDQTHLFVCHISNSPDLPDRTEYLMGRVEMNPALGMVNVFRCAWDGLRAMDREAVGGIPCNTFHSPAIFGAFQQLLADASIRIEVLNMLDETARHIETRYSRLQRIGVLSTTGTRKTGLYRELLESRGRSILEVPESLQEDVHDCVYNREWGIKAVNPVTKKARGRLLEMVNRLMDEGAEAVILACTEIPLALPEASVEGTPLIDPVVALARALISKAAPEKLKPL